MGRFSTEFKALLDSAGMSQKDYSKASGKDYHAVNHWVNDRRDPNYQDLLEIQNIFPEVDYNRFFKSTSMEKLVAETQAKYKNNDPFKEVKTYTKLLAEAVKRATETQDGHK